MNEILETMIAVDRRFECASEQATKALDKEYHRWVEDFEKEWDTFFKQAWKPFTFREMLSFVNLSTCHRIITMHCDCLEEAFREHCSSRVKDLEKNARCILHLQEVTLHQDLRPFSLQLWHRDPKAYRKICDFLIGDYALKKKHYDLDDYYAFAEIIIDAVHTVHVRNCFDTICMSWVIPDNERLSKSIWKYLPSSPSIMLFMLRTAEFNKSMSSITQKCLFSRMRSMDESYWKSMCEKYFLQPEQCVVESIKKEMLL